MTAYILVLFIVAAWVACGIKSYTITRAHYRRRAAEWLERWGDNKSAYRWTVSERRESLVFSLLGPAALLATWIIYSDPDSEDANW